MCFYRLKGNKKIILNASSFVIIIIIIIIIIIMYLFIYFKGSSLRVRMDTLSTVGIYPFDPTASNKWRFELWNNKVTFPGDSAWHTSQWQQGWSFQLMATYPNQVIKSLESFLIWVSYSNYLYGLYLLPFWLTIIYNLRATLH